MSHWNTESNRITVKIFVYEHTSTVIIPESRHVSEAKYLTWHTLLSGYVHVILLYTLCCLVSHLEMHTNPTVNELVCIQLFRMWYIRYSYKLSNMPDVSVVCLGWINKMKLLVLSWWKIWKFIHIFTPFPQLTFKTLKSIFFFKLNVPY